MWEGSSNHRENQVMNLPNKKKHHLEIEGKKKKNKARFLYEPMKISSNNA